MKRILALFTVLAAGLAACDKDPTGPAPRRLDVGDEVQLNVNFDDNCSNAVLRTGRVAAVSQRAVIVADDSNPTGGFTDTEYQSFADEYDRLVWPVVTRNFGEPHDMDGNGRVIVFFTRAINDLTAPGASSYVNGLFYSRDVFPKKATRTLGACASSNESELLYMLVPDPARGGAFSKDNVRRSTVGVMAHETQHLISASRRLYKTGTPGDGWNEVIWLNEGMSHVAEELVFYEAAGLSPRRNLDRPTLQSSATYVNAFNAYMEQNTGRLGSFYQNPEGNSPYETDDDLATRGAIWNFLRYAADRRAGDDRALWSALVNSSQTGMANLRTALGTDPVPLFRDWAVSLYTDDAVPGVDARFSQPSWNFRSIFLNGIPLRTRALANGGTTAVSLEAGGAGYFRFGVGLLPAEVRVTSGGLAPSGACTAVPALAVGQVHATPAGSGQALCVQQPGDYTLVAFYGAEAEGDPLPVQVSATGIQAVAPQPSPSRSPAGATAFAMGSAPRQLLPVDTEFERKIRLQEQALDALVTGGSGARFSSAAAAPDPSKLYLAVARTR
jgi:hypothetical protein